MGSTSMRGITGGPGGGGGGAFAGCLPPCLEETLLGTAELEVGRLVGVCASMSTMLMSTTGLGDGGFFEEIMNINTRTAQNRGEHEVPTRAQGGTVVGLVDTSYGGGVRLE